jgi:hypothetical protein
MAALEGRTHDIHVSNALEREVNAACRSEMGEIMQDNDK